MRESPLADLVRRMASEGCSAELIAAAVEAAEIHAAGNSRRYPNSPRASGHCEACEARRERERERKTRVRGHSADIPRTQKKDPPDPPKENQDTPPTPPKGGFPPTPKTELETVLDADRAVAVVDHRQRIRKPLTAHAAKLLAGKFAQCPDPNAAADAMIAAGWQGFEPQWLEGRTVAYHGPGPPRAANGAANHWQRLDQEFRERIDGCDEGPDEADFASLAGNVHRLSGPGS